MIGDLLRPNCVAPTFTLLEIGARPAGEAEPFHDLLAAFAGSRIHAFEVDPTLCEQLNRTAPAGLRFHARALAGSEGRRTLYETRHPMCSSLHEPNERWPDVFGELDVTRLARTVPIEATTLDVFAARERIGPVDAIKMDIQGAELEALQGGARVLHDVLFIVTEVEFVPMYKGQPLYGDVDAFLRNRGFMLHKFLGLSGRTAKPLAVADNPFHAGQHMWADAVFIRDLFRLGERSPEQLLKLAVLLELYGSPDLAHYVLEVRDKRAGSSLAPVFLQALLGPA